MSRRSVAHFAFFMRPTGAKNRTGVAQTFSREGGDSHEYMGHGGGGESAFRRHTAADKPADFQGRISGFAAGRDAQGRRLDDPQTVRPNGVEGRQTAQEAEESEESIERDKEDDVANRNSEGL